MNSQASPRSGWDSHCRSPVPLSETPDLHKKDFASAASFQPKRTNDGAAVRFCAHRNLILFIEGPGGRASGAEGAPLVLPAFPVPVSAECTRDISSQGEAAFWSARVQVCVVLRYDPRVHIGKPPPFACTMVQHVTVFCGPCRQQVGPLGCGCGPGLVIPLAVVLSMTAGLVLEQTLSRIFISSSSVAQWKSLWIWLWITMWIAHCSACEHIAIPAGGEGFLSPQQF